ncbi:hypothetical protein BS78_09G223200 [Paspalum vaginatum]|nr:hypothetical protein BS78_09G223200 [Paspalum vaginatum]
MLSLDHTIAEADPVAVVWCKTSALLMDKMNKPWSTGKRRAGGGGGGGGGLSRVLREQKARLYIIRRCVVMLLCYHD